MKRLITVVVAAGLLATGCRSTSPVAAQESSPSTAVAAPAASPPATPLRPQPSTPEIGRPERFSAAVTVIGPATRAHMVSWRPGCPVPVEELRVVHLTYWGFDGAPHRGELVVNRRAADAVVTVMRRLFTVRFPIRRMEPIDAYGGDDERSMAADNTSAFNCRSAKGHPGVWSEHSFGWAIDIDPLENPYVEGGVVDPPAGRAYADRSRSAPGMIHAGDAVVRAFTAVGWGWGGGWSSIKDYQHFSATGR